MSKDIETSNHWFLHFIRHSLRKKCLVFTKWNIIALVNIIHSVAGNVDK